MCICDRVFNFASDPSNVVNVVHAPCGKRLETSRNDIIGSLFAAMVLGVGIVCYDSMPEGIRGVVTIVTYAAAFTVARSLFNIATDRFGKRYSYILADEQV